MPRAVWWECLPEPTVPVPIARREVVMPVLPRVTVSDAENFWVRAGMATERPQPREQDATKAPAAKRDERWRKSRRSMRTSGLAPLKATPGGTDRAEESLANGL